VPRAGRKKGADSYKIDKYVVPWLPEYCRLAKRNHGLEAIPAIRMLVNRAPWFFGHHKPESTARRLHQKMTSRRYKKPTQPRGMIYHWSKVFLTLEPIEPIGPIGPLKTKKKSSKST